MSVAARVKLYAAVAVELAGRRRSASPRQRVSRHFKFETRAAMPLQKLRGSRQYEKPAPPSAVSFHDIIHHGTGDVECSGKEIAPSSCAEVPFTLSWGAYTIRLGMFVVFPKSTAHMGIADWRSPPPAKS